MYLFIDKKLFVFSIWLIKSAFMYFIEENNGSIKDIIILKKVIVNENNKILNENLNFSLEAILVM